MQLISQITKNYKTIARLDPLLMDEEFLNFPQINKKNDLKHLENMLSRGIDESKKLDLSDFNIAHALLRDIGFIISSLRRHNIQPALKNKELNNLLINLSKVTKTIPRETSYHYGICNPDNLRRRRFTSFKDEDALINGVKIFALDLEKVLHGILTIYEDLEHNRSIDIDFINQVLSFFSKSLESVKVELLKIDPFTFSNHLRPFFDPITINNMEYVGPGGGQIPLLVIDSVLFGFDLPEKHVYKTFSYEGVNFLTPELISIFNKYKEKPTLIKLNIERKNKKVEDFLEAVLNELIRFRQIHFHLAKTSLNEQNRGNYTTGSAGYRVGMVEETLKATKNSKRKII